MMRRRRAPSRCAVVARAVVGVLVILATAAPAVAKEQTGTRTGTARPKCAAPADGPVCGSRIGVVGRSDFTLTPGVRADLDVFFYDKRGALTDQFTTVGCTPEFGRTSEDASFAVVVVVARSACNVSTTVPFTYGYRVVPRSPCPEIAPNCKPLFARIAGYLILGVLFGPVLAVALVVAVRRLQRGRAAG